MGPLQRDENNKILPRHSPLMTRVLIDIASLYGFDELPTVTYRDPERGNPETLNLLLMVQHLHKRYQALQTSLTTDLNTQLDAQQLEHFKNPVLTTSPHPDYKSTLAHQRYLTIMKSSGQKLEEVVSGLLADPVATTTAEYLNLRGTNTVTTASFKTPLVDDGTVVPVRPTALCHVEIANLHNVYRYLTFLLSEN